MICAQLRDRRSTVLTQLNEEISVRYIPVTNQATYPKINETISMTETYIETQAATLWALAAGRC